MSLVTPSQPALLVVITALVGLSGCGGSSATNTSMFTSAKPTISTVPSLKGSGLCAVITADDAATVVRRAGAVGSGELHRRFECGHRRARTDGGRHRQKTRSGDGVLGPGG